MEPSPAGSLDADSKPPAPKPPIPPRVPAVVPNVDSDRTPLAPTAVGLPLNPPSTAAPPAIPPRMSQNNAPVSVDLHAKELLMNTQLEQGILNFMFFKT